jgi:hypothetical protein
MTLGLVGMFSLMRRFIDLESWASAINEAFVAR